MKRAALALAGLGTLLAGYLVLAGGEPACVIAHGCSVVQNSRYAELLGVPVAALGLGAYAVIGLASARDLHATAATTALIGAGFSAWLTYVEVFELEAICAWCVASAVVMTALAAVTVTRMVRTG